MSKLVNHINLADEEGNVFCRKKNEVVTLDDYHFTNHCSKCDMFVGAAQGGGVECEWTDLREKVKNPFVVSNPYYEKNQVIIQDVKNKQNKPDLTL
jgi:hypothetical protein